MTDTATDPVLRIRMVADKSDGSERVKRFDPVTGHAYLADPDTWDLDDRATWQEKPWPLLGVLVENKPAACRVPITWVNKGIAGGFVSLNDTTLAHRPGGPPSNPWQLTHTFTHAKTLTIHTLEGDVVYNVVHQPDKYVVVDRTTLNDEKGLVEEHIDPDAKVTDEIYAAGDTRVDHFYDLELVNS
jgi:hypothetical protein